MNDEQKKIVGSSPFIDARGIEGGLISVEAVGTYIFCERGLFRKDGPGLWRNMDTGKLHDIWGIEEVTDNGDEGKPEK